MNKNITFKDVKNKYETTKKTNYDKISKLFSKDNLLWKDYCDLTLPLTEEINKSFAIMLSYIESSYNTKINDFPEYGQYIELQEFKSCCEAHGFVDEDGSGNLCIKNKMTDYSVSPSFILKYSGFINKCYDGIFWFNK